MLIIALDILLFFVAICTLIIASSSIFATLVSHLRVAEAVVYLASRIGEFLRRVLDVSFQVAQGRGFEQRG
jgi:hypothetical protein